MKFASIVKTNPALKDSSAPFPGVETPFQPAEAEFKSPHPELPAVNPAVLEEEIREKIEKEYASKLSALQETLDRLSAEKNKEAEESRLAMEKLFQEKAQIFLSHVEQLEKINAELRASNQSLEKGKTELEGSAQGQVEALKAQMLELQRNFLEKEKKSHEEWQRILDSERARAEKKTAEEFSQKARETTQELEKKIREREERLQDLQREIEEIKKRPAPPAQAEPSSLSAPPAAQGMPVVPPPPSAAAVFSNQEHFENKPLQKGASKPFSKEDTPLSFSNEEFEQHNRETDRLYQSLVHAAQVFFQEFQEQKNPDLSGLYDPINELIKAVIVDDKDLIRVFVQPYPMSENYFPYHGANVAFLSVQLGFDIGIEPKDLPKLGLAALIHDVGLVYNQQALDMPGTLTEAAKKEVLEHPIRGAAMIENCNPGEDVLDAIRQHHEIGSGQGYPKGLYTESIHTFAKIINIADSFEAMTHSRPYRQRPMEVNQAVKEMIEKERGIYDRDVMKALISRVGLYPISSLVQLSNRQVARVLRQNRHFPLSPLIQIEFDEDGVKLKDTVLIDLAKNQLIHINGPLQQLPSVSKERICRGNKPVIPKKNISAITEVIGSIVMFLLIGAGVAALIFFVLKI